uniref:Major facilitator superfamily (MFS) profile domain-containing protein n=1 Tax=Trichogramma kaykai TaxID=54128 RepID=A0ABD2WU41_9HYME
MFCRTTAGGDSKGSDVEMVPPDGGWGWFVLIAAVMVNFLIPGGIKSFGVLYKAFLQNFNANESTGSWIPALCYFLYSSLGPLSSVLSVKYSYRTVTLVGGTFAAVGMMLSYFATSIQFLYVSYGIFVGIGAGLAFPPTVYITTSYFVRLRGLANGFCISGSALGSIIMPPVITHMLRTFSVRGVILIMGALTLNTWACALLYQPLEKHLIPRKKDNSGKEEEEALRPLAEAEEDDEEEEKEKGDKDNKDKDAEDKKDSETGKGPEVDIAVTSPEQEDKPAITSPTSPMSNAENSSVAAAQMAAEVTPVPKSASSVALENYYNKQPPPHSRLRKISMPSHMAGQMHSTPVLTSHQQYQLHHMHQQRPTRRSTTSRPPLMSPSQSSFNYISTPYHGSTLTALHPEFASTLTLNALSSTFRHKTPEKNAKKDAENVAEQNQNKFFDYRLLLDPMYLVILISNSTNAISYTNFVVVLTIYADKYLGFTDAQASLLLTIISAFDLIGRVGGAALWPSTAACSASPRASTWASRRSSWPTCSAWRSSPRPTAYRSSSTASFNSSARRSAASSPRSSAGARFSRPSASCSWSGPASGASCPSSECARSAPDAPSSRSAATSSADCRPTTPVRRSPSGRGKKPMISRRAAAAPTRRFITSILARDRSGEMRAMTDREPTRRRVRRRRVGFFPPEIEFCKRRSRFRSERKNFSIAKS